MFKNDWLERQIQSIAESLSVAIFGKKKFFKIIDNFEESGSETSGEGIDHDLLKALTDHYLRNDKINEAENLIFDSINKDKSLSKLILALSFYNTIIAFSDGKLAQCNFSREEITEGINELQSLYDSRELN